MATKIPHIYVDPSKLPGFAQDYEYDASDSEDSHGFPHEPDYAEKVCESILKHRLALLKLPSKYAALYESFLEPATFPSIVKDMEVSSQLKKSRSMLEKDVLSPELLDVLKGWSTVCEHVTRHVAQRLRRKCLKRPLEPPAHHESHGQLRIAINCDTEPHNDNSYVTILGTGNMRGTLKLEIPGREEWPACEDYIEEMSMSQTDGPTFMMFAGSKLCAIDAEDYRPLNHVVEWTKDQVSQSERINATYFVRNYGEGYDDATHDITSTNLQFQHWNRIIMQSELQHRPPRPPPVAVIAEAAGPEVSAEEEFLENGVMDWSTDGVPLADQSDEYSKKNSLLNLMWSRLGACLEGFCSA